jgi:Xaa-Pro aminopeptidase
MIRLRLQKTAAELQAIRKSCAIADKIAGRLKDIFTPDRWFYEVVADIEHIARLEGAEGGFFLISRLPIFGIPMRVLADPEIIQPGQRYMVEISPRYDGYYSQLTLPVTTRADDGIIGSAYADIITAKQSAQKLMLPGADLTNISVQLKAFFAERGHVMAPSLGHFCGLALEEPRHDPSQPFLLEEGMSFIFHPVLAHPELNSLMRADTYVITPDGAERLNKFPMEMVKIG